MHASWIHALVILGVTVNVSALQCRPMHQNAVNKEYISDGDQKTSVVSKVNISLRILKVTVDRSVLKCSMQYRQSCTCFCCIEQDGSTLLLRVSRLMERDSCLNIALNAKLRVET